VENKILRAEKFPDPKILAGWKINFLMNKNSGKPRLNSALTGSI
jgi:hypothetical protein